MLIIFFYDVNQEITFFAVGAHHYNNTSEPHIKITTLGARDLLLHAQRHWPEAITTMVWPIYLLAVTDIEVH